MATLSHVKTYGGLGSLLILLAPVPAVGVVLAIAGFILTLVAISNISDLIKDSSIMNTMLISIFAAIAGVAVGFFVILGSVLRFIGLNNLMVPNFNPATVATGDWVGLALSVFAGLFVTWILLIVSGIFLRRGYSRIGTALNVNLFKTAGLLFLIGAATTIIFVGFLLIPIAIILLTVAFFSINENATLSPPIQTA